MSEILTLKPSEAASAGPAGSGYDSQLATILERYWGYRSFRPLQREAAESILAGRDSLLVLPTGGGKSLCFQAPALTSCDGLAVVVSPLISLMKDQVDALIANGVPAAYYNSSLTPDQQGRVAARIRQGRYRLLYVSPERLMAANSQRFHELLRESGLRYVAIDEAHCISHWGHDFRPEYRQLGRLREFFPEISLHAYTATATERVRADILTQLGLRDPEVLVGSFDRPNLVYRSLRRQGPYRQLRAVVERHKDEAGIIYCLSRKKVEDLASRLHDDGYRVVPYHAGLSDYNRRHYQELFLNEQVDIVVATVAFGMGIDRSNVRYVIHANAPRSLEHYLQESGRSGRDGLEAECLLFWTPSDFLTWQRMLQKNNELTPEAHHHLREMERYATQTRCRHRALCAHFGQDYGQESCKACDWCLGELEAAAEPVVLAQKILSCVLRVKQSWGAAHVIDVLRGRDTEKVRSRRHDQLSTFGLLADTPVPELRGYIDQLVEQRFLVLDGDKYPILKVTPEGWRLVKAEIPCELFHHRRPEKKKRRRRGKATESWEGVDRGLFDVLRQLRLEIARERQVPPYVVFQDSVLRDLARQRPSDETAFLAIHGVGRQKASDFGARFLQAVEAHCAEHGLERDCPAIAPPPPSDDDPGAGHLPLDARELFVRGVSIEAAAASLNKTTGTVGDYLARWIHRTRPASIEPWVPEELLERIRAVSEQPGFNLHRMKPYYEHFNGEIGYDRIKVALAFLAVHGTADRETEASPLTEHP